MPIHIHLLPIPPPHHADNDPDPPTLFHYTTGLKLDLILRSGHIRPSTALVPASEKPVTWFSTSEHWEPTATKCPIPGKLGQLITASAQNGLIRITVPASVAPHRFQELPSLAGTSPEIFLGLLVAGLKLGADPGSWRFSLGPVSVALFRGIELFDFADDRWLALDMAALACRN